MATFYYKYIREMEPRPGVRYATRYIKQTDQEHKRLQVWLAEIAETIIDIADHDPQVAEWFTRPDPNFRRSDRTYYSPEDLITDMLNQMHRGRDLPQSMVDRWNRLTDTTPWQIQLIQGKPEQIPTRAAVLVAD